MFWIGRLASPQSWPDTAQTFAAAMSGDASAVLDAVNEKELVDLERSAVSCNDNKPFTLPPISDIVDELLTVYQNVSRSVFSVVTTELDGGCTSVTNGEDHKCTYLSVWEHYCSHMNSQFLDL